MLSQINIFKYSPRSYYYSLTWTVCLPFGNKFPYKNIWLGAFPSVQPLLKILFGTLLSPAPSIRLWVKLLKMHVYSSVFFVLGTMLFASSLIWLYSKNLCGQSWKLNEENQVTTLPRVIKPHLSAYFEGLKENVIDWLGTHGIFTIKKVYTYIAQTSELRSRPTICMWYNSALPTFIRIFKYDCISEFIFILIG